jgi:hypothetical protein
MECELWQQESRKVDLKRYMQAKIDPYRQKDQCCKEKKRKKTYIVETCDKTQAKRAVQTK